MGDLVAPGTRQEGRDQDGAGQKSEGDRFRKRQSATQGQIAGEAGKRHDPGAQLGRDEGAVARSDQEIGFGGRVDETVHDSPLPD